MEDGLIRHKGMALTMQIIPQRVEQATTILRMYDSDGLASGGYASLA